MVDAAVALVKALVALVDLLPESEDLRTSASRLLQLFIEGTSVAEASVLLRDSSGGLVLLAASSSVVRDIELAHLDGPEPGPAVECARSGQPRTVDDLRSGDERWAGFCAKVADAGFRSLKAVPLRVGDTVIGAVDLYVSKANPLTLAEQRRVSSFADFAATSLLQEASRQSTLQRAEQLQAALDSRVVIEQAKGMLAEHGQISVTAAFEALRSFCRAGNLTIDGVAHSLVRGRRTPEEVLRAVPRQRHRPDPGALRRPSDRP
jgi:GAF domain-containing protein